MKRIIVLILTVIFLLSIVVNTGCKDTMKIDNAKARVRAILKGIHVKEDGTPPAGDEETAICQWYAGKARITDPSALNAASDGFDEWRNEMGIFPYIDDYTIEDAVIDGDDVIVFVTVNGMPMTVRVPPGDQVSWSDYVPDYEDDEDDDEDEGE